MDKDREMETCATSGKIEKWERVPLVDEKREMGKVATKSENVNRKYNVLEREKC